jgi:hypothetical protein
MGEARKVDAYQSEESCSEVADSYSRFMSSTHWSRLAVASSGPRNVSQGWRYMSRKLYVAGATGIGGSGCIVMLAIYDHSPDRYQAK